MSVKLMGAPWRADEARLQWLWSLVAGSRVTVAVARRGAPVWRGVEEVKAVRTHYLVCAGRRFSLRTGGEVGAAHKVARAWIEPWGGFA